MHAGIVDQALTRRLRQQVLRPHLTPDDVLPGDEVADIAVHFAAWLDDPADTDDPADASGATGGAVGIGGAVGTGGAGGTGGAAGQQPPISACVVYPDRCPFRSAEAPWHLRQMATDPEHRGIGAGRALLAAVVDELSDRGADLLWCNARVSAQAFYERLGWVGHGDVFTDERHTVPHIRMWRPIPGSGLR